MEKPYLIGITGGSGSGKTSFINHLKESFQADELCVISQDDYYKPYEKQLPDEKGIHNFDMPRSIYRKEFSADLLKLLDGETITREEYTFNNKEAIPSVLTFKPCPVIIVEGLFIFHFKKIRKLMDLKVYLHAKENLKVIRRIKRDQIERNYPIEDVLYRYEAHVLPAFEKYIKPYIDKADLVINNNDNFDAGLEVLKGYIRYRLDGVKR